MRRRLRGRAGAHARWLAAALAAGACGVDPGVRATSGGGDTGGPGGAGFTFRTSDGGMVVGTPTVEGNNCGVTTHGLKRLPPEILLVLDRSGSMVENKTDGPVCQTRACGTRWQEVTSALRPALERTQAGIHWGLKIYPDDDLCLVNPGATVPIGPMNAATIIAAYGVRPPVAQKSHTPTREAVRKGGAYVRTLTSPNPKFILLATDGEPNCAVAGASVKDTLASVAAVADVASAGIPIFVVGVATSKTTTNDTLNMMAVGGGRPRPDPASRYYAVDTSEDLQRALDTISAQAASCTFALGMAPPAPDNVAVNLDGVRVLRDPARRNGWEYGAGGTTSIELYGEACARVQGGTAQNVQMIFGCPGMAIE